jgi:hypothetical protein
MLFLMVAAVGIMWQVTGGADSLSTLQDRIRQS